jgi:phosphatidylinositol alpha-mannosyltransferase
MTEEEGVRIVRLPRPRGRDDERIGTRFGWRLLPRLAGDSFDVVHSLGTPDAASSVLVDAIRRDRVTAYTNLGAPERRYWRTRRDHLHHSFVARYVDVYGCLSHYAAAWLERDYGRTASLTPGGVRLDRFQPAQQRAPVPTLLYSGALEEPRKGVAGLLEAVAVLARTVPDLRLWLSGPGNAARLLADAPREARERTELLPLGTPDMAGVYGSAWATVLPSTFEAFGLTLLESLACGTPIVGMDHGALPELVRPSHGALAAPGDPDSLAEACGRALELATDADIVERCRTAATPFDWDSGLAPEFERLYAKAK